MSEGPASIPPSDIQYKVVLVGDSGVGKTSLILKFVDNIFNEESVSNMGVDCKTKVITVKGKKVALVIWDTAGQERFRTISGSFYNGAKGIIIVYDITDEESFRSVQIWATEIDRYVQNSDIQQLLVGNKSDLSEKRAVSKTAAEETAEKIQVKYFETSAKSGENVEKIFETLVQDILEGATEDTRGGASGGSDIIKVSAATQKASPKKKKCCGSKSNN